MWQALATAASLELEASSNHLLSSYERLNAATIELHQRVKELLAAYPDGDELPRPTAGKATGAEGDALGHANQLFAQLCAKFPRIDEGSAPGAIFTPRTAPKGGLVAVEHGVSMLAGADKLRPLLMADVPALRWHDSTGSTGCGPGPTLQAGAVQTPPPPGVGTRAGKGQKLAPKLHISVDSVGSLEDPLKALRDYCEDVRKETRCELREMLSATGSAVGVHRQLLSDAVELDSVPSPAQAGAQWCAPRVRADVQARVRQLLVTMVHTSKGSDDAWAAVMEALMHDLAQPDGQTLRMLAVADLPAASRPAAGLESTFNPEKFSERLAELRQEGERWLQELLQRRDESGRSLLQENHSAKDFAAFRTAILPASYLQMVGQALLYHAAVQLPAMADLPERIPAWVLRALYARPLAEAVKAAAVHALSGGACEGGATGSSGSDESQPGDQSARFQLSGRLPSASRTGQAGAAGPGSSSGQLGAAGRCASASAAVRSSDGAEVALQRATSAMSRLTAVFRDLAAFESAFSDIIAQSGVPKFLVRADHVSMETASLQPPPAIPPRTAAEYCEIVREEVTRALRDVRVLLQDMVFGQLKSAVQACLSASDALADVPVATDAWPPHPDERGQVATAPQRIDAGSQRVLLLVVRLQVRLVEYPEPVQVVLMGALVECLSILMDRLWASCTTLRDMPREPLPRLLLFHSAACCLRRRLELLPCGRLTGPAADEHYLALVQQHGQCLVQADELVGSLHRHIVQAHMDAVRTAVLTCADRTDWGTFRPEVMRGQSAGPAVRVWHFLMMQTLHAAARISPTGAAEWMVGQALQDGLACLAQRLLDVCPSVQMLREYVADVVHVVATAGLLCLPLLVRSTSAAAQQANEDPLGQVGKGSRWLRLPYPMAAAVSATARELLVRAALLHIPATKLQQIVTAVRLLPQAAAADPPAASTLPTADARPPVPSALARIPGQSRGKSQSVPSAAASAPLRRLTDDSSASGSSTAAGGDTRLAPLPAINAHRTSQSLHESAAGPVAESQEEAERPSHRGQRTADAGGSGRPTTPPNGGPQPQQLQPTAAVAAPAGRFSSSAVAGDRPGDDDERLSLWSSWLPVDVLRGLQTEAGGLELGSDVLVTRLLPLEDRMAEASVSGRTWRLCLERLAEQASGEQVLLALARRCELHVAVGNEPNGHAANMAIVRGMARQVGLLREDEL